MGAAGLASGCELVVGELPEAVDSVALVDGGDSRGTGGRGSGGGAIGNTGGSAAVPAAGGTSSSGGRASSTGGSSSSGGTTPIEGGSDGGSSGAGGSAQGGNSSGGSDSGGSDGGPASGTGGQVSTGGAPNSGGQGTTGGAPNSGGQGTTGGAPSTGGRVGSGGVSATGGSVSNGGASSCKNPPCDCDGDGGISVACANGDDCDDSDPLVYKNEPVYYATPSLHRGFDYDCSNTLDIQPEINKRQSCNVTNLLDCKTTTQGFLVPIPPCGASGDWGTCTKPLGLSCANSKLGTQQVFCK